MRDSTELEPAGGWPTFKGSVELTDALVALASSEHWHYLNFTAGSSIWESRRDASTVGVHYDGGRRIVQLWADRGDAFELLAPLVARFELIPVAGVTSDATGVCDVCARSTNIHLTEIVNGAKTSRWVCVEHLPEMGDGPPCGPHRTSAEEVASRREQFGAADQKVADPVRHSEFEAEIEKGITKNETGRGRLDNSDDGQLRDSTDQAVGIDVALVNTTAINRDGTPRQAVLAECDERTRILIGEDLGNGNALGVLVRRRQVGDQTAGFGWVGEFPPEFRSLRPAGWIFEFRAHEVIKDGHTLGMRIRGRFVPPPAGSVGEDETSFFDM